MLAIRGYTTTARLRTGRTTPTAWTRRSSSGISSNSSNFSKNRIRNARGSSRSRSKSSRGFNKRTLTMLEDSKRTRDNNSNSNSSSRDMSNNSRSWNKNRPRNTRGRIARRTTSRPTPNRRKRRSLTTSRVYSQQQLPGGASFESRRSARSVSCASHKDSAFGSCIPARIGQR
jgi:hypothetical protein